MTPSSQQVYNIAEWLAYNREDLRVPELSLEHQLDYIIDKAKEHFNTMAIDEIESAFDDRKLLFIYDYYFKVKKEDYDTTH